MSADSKWRSTGTRNARGLDSPLHPRSDNGSNTPSIRRNRVPTPGHFGELSFLSCKALTVTPDLVIVKSDHSVSKVQAKCIPSVSVGMDLLNKHSFRQRRKSDTASLRHMHPVSPNHTNPTPNLQHPTRQPSVPPAQSYIKAFKNGRGNTDPLWREQRSQPLSHLDVIGNKLSCSSNITPLQTKKNSDASNDPVTTPVTFSQRSILALSQKRNVVPSGTLSGNPALKSLLSPRLSSRADNEVACAGTSAKAAPVPTSAPASAHGTTISSKDKDPYCLLRKHRSRSRVSNMSTGSTVAHGHKRDNRPAHHLDPNRKTSTSAASSASASIPHKDKNKDPTSRSELLAKPQPSVGPASSRTASWSETTGDQSRKASKQDASKTSCPTTRHSPIKNKKCGCVHFKTTKKGKRRRDLSDSTEISRSPSVSIFALPLSRAPSVIGLKMTAAGQHGFLRNSGTGTDTPETSFTVMNVSPTSTPIPTPTSTSTDIQIQPVCDVGSKATRSRGTCTSPLPFLDRRRANHRSVYIQVDASDRLPCDAKTLFQKLLPRTNALANKRKQPTPTSSWYLARAHDAQSRSASLTSHNFSDKSFVTYIDVQYDFDKVKAIVKVSSCRHSGSNAPSIIGSTYRESLPVGSVSSQGKSSSQLGLSAVSKKCRTAPSSR